MPTYLNSEEAQKHLASLGFSVSTNFLRVHARSGKLPHTKLGKRYLFTIDNLNTLVTQNAQHSDFKIS